MSPRVSELAIGRWHGILTALGVDPAYLTGRHTPCPVCGGKDRFRFDDKGGRGTFFCSHCGAGDGFNLLQNLYGWNFSTAAREVERVAGVVCPERTGPNAHKESWPDAVARVWDQAKPLKVGDEAMRYFAGRGLIMDAAPENLRLHPNLHYRYDDGTFGRFPALIASVAAPDGSRVSLHRTYLKDGVKAPVPAPRKLLTSMVQGAAIHLHPACEVLGVAEGIETALAARQIFGVPVWSCISAIGIESFVSPAGVQKLLVFGDNDASGTGQAAAWCLAKRLIATGIDVQVRIPGIAGTDWADVVQRRQPHTHQATTLLGGSRHA